jgi:hypothetical protein
LKIEEDEAEPERALTNAQTDYCLEAARDAGRDEAEQTRSTKQMKDSLTGLRFNQLSDTASVDKLIDLEQREPITQELPA